MPLPLMDAPWDVTIETSGAVSDAEHAILRLNARRDPALLPLARLLLRTESIASSKVEGLQVGVRQLARAETEPGGRRVSATARAVLANITAMQVAVEDAASAQRFGIADLLSIHRALMMQAPPASSAGSIRTEQNWIGGNDYTPCGADFVPPPPEHLPELLEDLCAAIADDTLPPLVQAGVVHAQFETIHPFVDGNGRTGRALIHVMLRKRGLADTYVTPISVLLAMERTGYIKGLVDFREDRVDAWIERFATAAARAAHLATDYLDAVGRLRDRWRKALGDGSAPRSDAAAWAVIDVLPAYPIITSSVAVAATGRAKAAVHAALEQLQGCGVLEPTSAAKRNRAWEATGLVHLLEQLEAERLPEV